MSKILLRIVALLLVPCILMDPLQSFASECPFEQSAVLTSRAASAAIPETALAPRLPFGMQLMDAHGQEAFLGFTHRPFSSRRAPVAGAFGTPWSLLLRFGALWAFGVGSLVQGLLTGYAAHASHGSGVWTAGILIGIFITNFVAQPLLGILAYDPAGRQWQSIRLFLPAGIFFVINRRTWLKTFSRVAFDPEHYPRIAQWLKADKAVQMKYPYLRIATLNAMMANLALFGFIPAAFGAPWWLTVFLAALLPFIPSIWNAWRFERKNALPRKSPELTPEESKRARGNVLWSSSDREEIVAALPPDLQDQTRAVEYLIVRFGEQWKEALSMIGPHLFNPTRHALIEKMLQHNRSHRHNQKLTIYHMADLLYFQRLRGWFTFENFPDEFQQMVFRYANRRKAGIQSRNLGLLWILCQPVWSYPINSPMLRLLTRKMLQIYRVAVDTFRREHEAVLSTRDPDQIIPVILDALNIRPRNAVYTGGGPYHIPSTKHEEIPLAPESVFGAVAGQQIRCFVGVDLLYPWDEALTIYLADPALLDEIRPHIPPDRWEEDGTLLLGTIYFKTSVFNARAAIRVHSVQAWLRNSDELSEALKMMAASLEETLSEAAQAYAEYALKWRLLIRTGGAMFEKGTPSLRTIRRLNSQYLVPPYGLVFDAFEGVWRWRRDSYALLLPLRTHEDQLTRTSG